MTVIEVLESINANVNNLQKYSANTYLRNLLEVAFLKRFKMDLPEGLPPFRPSEIPEGQNPGGFWAVARRIKDVNKYPQTSKEKLFISFLESITSGEVKVLEAVKNQDLASLYPNLTLGKVRHTGYFKEIVSME